MLAEPQEEGLFSTQHIKDYIGRSFKDKLRYIVPEWYTDEEIADYLIKKSICIHLAVSYLALLLGPLNKFSFNFCLAKI